MAPCLAIHWPIHASIHSANFCFACSGITTGTEASGLQNRHSSCPCGVYSPSGRKALIKGSPTYTWVHKNSGFLFNWPREVQFSFELRVRTGDCSRDTAGPNRPHLGLCPGPNVPLLGRQRSRHCILDSPGESGLVSRGSQGHRSPVKSRRVYLGAHCVA